MVLPINQVTSINLAVRSVPGSWYLVAQVGLQVFVTESISLDVRINVNGKMCRTVLSSTGVATIHTWLLKHVVKMISLIIFILINVDMRILWMYY